MSVTPASEPGRTGRTMGRWAPVVRDRLGRPGGVGAAARFRAGCSGGAEPDGFATVLMLALSTVVVLVACVLVALGGVAVARARAASAADQGALAAAHRFPQGAGAACTVATAVVDAAGATVRSCRFADQVATVDVEVRLSGPLGLLGAARGRARAGPAITG